MALTERTPAYTVPMCSGHCAPPERLLCTSRTGYCTLAERLYHRPSSLDRGTSSPRPSSTLPYGRFLPNSPFLSTMRPRRHRKPKRSAGPNESEFYVYNGTSSSESEPEHPTNARRTPPSSKRKINRSAHCSLTLPDSSRSHVSPSLPAMTERPDPYDQDARCGTTTLYPLLPTHRRGGGLRREPATWG